MLRAFVLSFGQLGDPKIAAVFVKSVLLTLLLLGILGAGLWCALAWSGAWLGLRDASGIGTALLFFVVNGWLLGRDLGEIVAARHMDDAALRGWRASSGPQRLALGVAGTGRFMVPILNLAAPVLGAAMATHLFHKGRTT